MSTQAHSVIPFTVCMSVYRNDDAAAFLMALRSVSTMQSVPPEEIVLVVDGPVPENTEEMIRQFRGEFANLRVVRFEENKGHAAARQAGMDAAATEWCAIMDSDDIARPDRFEKQLRYLSGHTDVDVLGGQIEEFAGITDNKTGKRVVPLCDKDIKHYLKARCPMNMMTVLVRKSVVEDSGGFIDWYCEEDYYLWIRMAEKNYIFANMPDVLVDVRAGSEMYSRRGGWRYFKSERMIQKYMVDKGIISCWRYCFNVTGRFVVQVILPNAVRGWLFRNVFRK